MYKIGKSDGNQDFDKKNSDNLTQQLINYIYSTVDLSKFKYEIIQYENELPQLLKQKHFVSVNFVGFNSLLVFCKIRDRYHTFTVDRQTLSYNKAKIDFNRVKIDFRRIGLDPSIYNGTIFDGLLIRRQRMNDLFIISDVYSFCGSDYTQMILKTKMELTFTYLNNNYKPGDSRNNLELTVNKVFDMDKTQHVIDKVIPSIRDIKTRGLCFYPETSGTKLIYLFGNENKESVKPTGATYKRDEQRPVKIQTKDVKISSPEKDSNSENGKTPLLKFVNKTNKQLFATLEMKSTAKIDVYKMFAVSKVDGDKGKKFLKKVNMGIAFIAGIDKSLMFRELMSKNPNKGILVKCKFNDNMNKWEPLEQDNDAKFPSQYSEIEKDMELVEVSDDE
jgi:hypothetical protein